MVDLTLARRCFSKEAANNKMFLTDGIVKMMYTFMEKFFLIGRGGLGKYVELSGIVFHKYILA